MSRRRPAPSRREVAFHEAGHAVVALHLGIVPLVVRLLDDAERLGSMMWGTGDGTSDEDRATVLYAGWPAELRGREAEGFPEFSESDETAAAALFPGRAGAKMRRALRLRAASLVAEHFPEIEAVAGALLAAEYGSLTLGEIERLVYQDARPAAGEAGEVDMSATRHGCQDE